MRPATIAAGGLVCAAAAMAVAVLEGGGRERAASAPPPAAPAERASARDGNAVWVANGCGSCHTFAPADATGRFGPDLTVTLKGMPASYIRESIVAPSKTTAAGYSAGGMPEDYAARIPPAELERLVEFIRAGVRG